MAKPRRKGLIKASKDWLTYYVHASVLCYIALLVPLALLLSIVWTSHTSGCSVGGCSQSSVRLSVSSFSLKSSEGVPEERSAQGYPKLSPRSETSLKSLILRHDPPKASALAQLVLQAQASSAAEKARQKKNRGWGMPGTKLSIRWGRGSSRHDKSRMSANSDTTQGGSGSSAVWDFLASEGLKSKIQQLEDLTENLIREASGEDADPVRLERHAAFLGGKVLVSGLTDRAQARSGLAGARSSADSGGVEQRGGGWNNGDRGRRGGDASQAGLLQSVASQAGLSGTGTQQHPLVAALGTMGVASSQGGLAADPQPDAQQTKAFLMQMLKSRDQLQAALAKLPVTPVHVPLEIASSPTQSLLRGIVIPAGGRVLLINAFVTITLLRDVHQCSLPIHIVYNGPSELDAYSKAFFETHFQEVTCIDGSKYPQPPLLLTGKVSGVQLKSWALLNAVFDQVLLLDADSLPLADPTPLFDSPAFLESGCLFWPDFWTDFVSNREVYQLFHLAPPMDRKEWKATTDGGQLLFDRARHSEVLQWLWFLNLHGPGALYEKMHGDKDTYRLAFELAGKGASFAQLPRPPVQALCDCPAHGLDLLHMGVVQYSAEGLPMFLHRTDTARLNPSDPVLIHHWRIDYLTAPLSHDRALNMGHAEGLGYFSSEIDTGVSDRCNVTALGHTYYQNHDCQVDITSGALRIPVVSVQHFPDLVAALNASYEAYDLALSQQQHHIHSLFQASL